MISAKRYTGRIIPAGWQIACLIPVLIIASCTGVLKFSNQYPDRIYLFTDEVIGQMGNDHAARLIDKILDACNHPMKCPELDILNPCHESVFPLDMASPEMVWEDNIFLSKMWLVRVSFTANQSIMCFLTHNNQWTPEQSIWEMIKSFSGGKDIFITILGIDPEGPDLVTARNEIIIYISRYTVSAPVFFQHMPLPFAYAAKHPELSRWCLGDISSYEPPRVVIENLSICGNCHGFSPDGTVFGMDMDFKEDKGAYALAAVGGTIVISPEHLISWNDFKKEDGIKSMGLFSRISPDNRYVVSTVQETSFFTMIPDIDFSQFFFPIKGLIAFYDRSEKRFFPLPGADHSAYVQTCPEWSPDGSTIVFARAEHDQRLIGLIGDKGFITIDPHVRIDDLNQAYRIRYDLYTVPFNNGKGGNPVPLAGASHNGKSNFFPRYSPDGKWIVFTQSDTGMAIQPSSRLFIIPSQGGVPQELACNTAVMNSWHSWSPDSRWIVFSSKVNTPYTQLFLSHIDEQGCASAPVLLSRFSSDSLACLVPEFVNQSVVEFSDFEIDRCFFISSPLNAEAAR